MTLDELAHTARCSAFTLDRWARDGAFGPRWQEPINQGRWRHITKDVARRACVMSALIEAGVAEAAASAITSILDVETIPERDAIDVQVTPQVRLSISTSRWPR